MSTGQDAPLLSVTVLNYNYGRYLNQCLDSIVAQDFRDFELIIINDKSADNSLEIIEPYLKDSRVRLIDHAENKGFTRSLIEGSEVSRGKYITVISADDWVSSPNAFSQQIRMMEDDDDIAFVYSAYGHYDSKARLGYVWRNGDDTNVKSSVEAFEQLVLSPFLLHSGTMIRKAAHDAVGGYDASYRYSIDTKMWLMLCHQGKVGYIAEMLYAYRRHQENMSKNMASFKASIQELLKAIESSFALWPAERQRELRKLRRESERKVLVSFAIDDIFRGWYRVGWKSWFEAFKLKPLATIGQKMTIVLVLRTVLGPSIFDLVRKRLGRDNALKIAC